MKNKIFTMVACFMMALHGYGQQQRSVTIRISNPLDFDRSEEMVEIPTTQVYQRLHLADTARLVVYDERAREVACQLTHDGLLIFPASVAAKASRDYTIRQGEPRAVTPAVYGRHYPERLDDIAWENDLGVYRVYGPALQKSGERAYGYDVFTKSVEHLVVERRYATQLNADSWARINALRAAGRSEEATKLERQISYHVDHGDGMDCYAVGPTLGAGTAALIADSQVVYPYCYKDYEIMDNGPLRFTMKLTFAPLRVGKDSAVVETRVIQLDKGGLLNKTLVSYANLSQPTPLAVGLVIHSANPKGYHYSSADGYTAYADPTTDTSGASGTLYVGAVFPEHTPETKVALFDKPVGDAMGHVLGISTYHPHDTFIYYWGAGWSKRGFQNERDWTDCLKTFRLKTRYPLEAHVIEQ